jgi:hypothetical protein
MVSDRCKQIGIDVGIVGVDRRRLLMQVKRDGIVDIEQIVCSVE